MLRLTATFILLIVLLHEFQFLLHHELFALEETVFGIVALSVVKIDFHGVSMLLDETHWRVTVVASVLL